VTASATGGCLCGGVRYQVHGDLRGVWACHCSQCRRSTGHIVAATQVSSEDLVLTEQATLTWYRSSEEAERGFCVKCGSNLFWRMVAEGRPRTSIMAGTLDAPTGLKLVMHIFVADKSDYYEIGDDAVQYATWPS
jgi:hypothetical protein